MKVEEALAFILALNVLFFLGQTVVTKINPEGSTFFHEDKSMIGDYNYNGNYTLDENAARELAGTQTAVDPENTNYFTDVWQSVKNWFQDTTIGKGVGYLLNIVNSLPHFLTAIGTPKEIAFALGFFWHALTIFLLVTYLKGGQ